MKKKTGSDNGLINIADIIEHSKVNGPGDRMVIYFQGCSMHCRGCYNPDLWAFEPRSLYTPQALFDLVKQINSESPIEGITLSGGEPFSQANILIPFFKMVREVNLSIICYTGYSLEGILASDEKQFIKYIDILSAGPYDENFKQEGLPLRGSSNKQLYFLTNRYSEKDLESNDVVEIILSEDGLIATGFIDDDFLKDLKLIFK